MRPFIILAGINGLLAVGMGAYAAHGLAADPLLQGFAERASTYQLIHAAALLAADRLAAERRPLAGLAGLLFVLGMALFSGSLYVRALTGAPLPIPMITPAGGMTLMAGWLTLAIAGFFRGR